MARIDPKNRTRFWWDGHMPGLSLMCADFTTQEFRPHAHDGYVVAITETGGSVIRSRGEEVEVKQPKLMVFNPGEPHEGWMGRSDHWRYRALYVYGPAMDAIADGIGMRELPRFMTNCIPDRELIDGFLALHRMLEHDDDLFGSRDALYEAFGTLFRRYGVGNGKIEPSPNDKPFFERASGMLKERYAENLLLEEISREIGLTSFQLIGLFKRCTGLTPHIYLVQLRIAAASKFMRRGMSIAEASLAAGFYDQSAMTKHFKRYLAITPMQYAAAWRKATPN